MRLLIFTILIFGFLFGCNSKNERNEDYSSTIESDKTLLDIDESILLIYETISLDTTKLVKSLNEFIPTITKISNQFICKFDTVQYDSIIDFRSNILFAEYAKVVCYTFECGEIYKNIMVLEARYSDSLDSKRVFSELNKINSNGHCLSKTNDFFIRTNNKILWINGSCHYPYYNYQKIERLFLSSLTSAVINDSIKCKCGGQNVTNK